jgi:mycothiol synthase
VTEVALRRFSTDDLDALRPAVERGRAAGEFRGSSDPEGAFFLKSFEFFPHPVELAVAAKGDVVGFISPEFKVVVVGPDHRRQGIGRRLVEAGIELERERGRPNLILGVLPDDTAGQSFLRAVDLSFHSTLWDLALPADATVAGPTWPAGIEARLFDRNRDARPFVALFNAAFASHATPLQMDESIVDQPPEPGFEDADTVVAIDPQVGELVGFCATSPERADGVVGPHAEIWTIGVRPDRQGQGLGRQLLRWGVQRLRAIGVTDVTLSVNGRNEHALALYESEGFVRVSTRERWARPVGGAGA